MCMVTVAFLRSVQIFLLTYLFALSSQHKSLTESLQGSRC